MVEDIQKEVEHWTEQIRHVDSLVELTVDGLIELAQWNVELATRGQHPFGLWVRQPMYFPAWLTDEREPGAQEQINLTTALCLRVLQRLSLTRRRFPHIEKKLEKLEESLSKNAGARDLTDALADAFLPKISSPDPYRSYIKTANLMGRWHPFSTANILWVLLHGGEAKAYTGAGVLSLFAMLWSMHGSEGGEGASIGMLPASAYVTNSCLMAIRSLQSACMRRAELVKQIADGIDEIERLVASGEHAARFPFLVDALLSLLFDFRRVAITGGAFTAPLARIERICHDLTVDARAGDVWGAVRNELHAIISNVATSGTKLLPDFTDVRALLSDICRSVEEASINDDPSDALQGLRDLGITVPKIAFAAHGGRKRFWKSRAEAAVRARDACDEAMRSFEQSIEACRHTPGLDAAALARAFRAIGEGNERVVQAIAPTVVAAERWCVGVVTREIANASSGNWTEFDPAELAGALEVATVAGRIDSPRLISDAIIKALEGLRGTGGWIAGQPFMIDDSFSLSVGAPTADVMFIIARVLRAYPKITEADPHLLVFIEWLTGSRTEFTVRQISEISLLKPLRLNGWVSERQARPRRVDLWTTAFTIDALLELRSLFEDRLWALCERRFTIIEDVSRLAEVQATDLGAPHGKRLHRKFVNMARATSGRRYKEADYALVLHGPPGSSKTMIVGAVASELWRADRFIPRPVRLVRITPADFTHRGEALVDFEARVIFTLLSNVRHVTVLFDEIDDLLRRRMFEEQPSFLKLVVPAMLNRLQDLRDACARQEVCFIVATNYIENIEPALIRKGRIDDVIPLVYPDRASRAELIETRLAELPTSAAWARDLLRPLLNDPKADRWPYKELDALCRGANMAAAALAGRDEARLRAIVVRLLEDGASAARLPYDAHRLQNIRKSEEFRREFVTYVLSGVSGAAEYSKAIRLYIRVASELEAENGGKPVAPSLTNLALQAGKTVWRRLRTSE
jgi:hypothetical protein